MPVPVLRNPSSQKLPVDYRVQLTLCADVQFDLPMVRFEATGKQKLGDRLYQRQDGTLAYFFSVEDIGQRADDAGFVINELKYACVHNRSHSKAGLQLLKRAFVHGVFSRPSD